MSEQEYLGVGTMTTLADDAIVILLGFDIPLVFRQASGRKMGTTISHCERQRIGTIKSSNVLKHVVP